MCTENQHTDKGGNSEKNLLDYAWKWFEYHAKQRVSMFNYFLIASGILAHACVNLICAECFVLAMVLAIIGIFVSGSFLILDCRNAQLVYLGEDVLRKLEKSILFPEDFTGIGEKNEQRPRGILFRELSENKRCPSKHKIWLRVVEALIALCFVVAGIVAFHGWRLDP